MRSNRINAGQYPHLVPTTKFAESDCLWWKAPEPELSAEGIRHQTSEFLPKHGINPAQQMYVGALSGDARRDRDAAAQSHAPADAQPSKMELSRGGSVLRVGDRVIQQVNDYGREVFNGDVGTVAGIDLEEQEIVVQFADERAVSYDYADFSESRWPGR